MSRRQSRTDNRARRALAVICAVLLAQGAGAQDLIDLPPAFAKRIEAARAECASYENGVFSMEWGSVRRVDLDGDLDRDWVLDEAGFVCSSTSQLFCGTGGCPSHFLIDDTLRSILNKDWQVVTTGGLRVVLAFVHGALCGGGYPTPCVDASTWDADSATWRSIITQ